MAHLSYAHLAVRISAVNLFARFGVLIAKPEKPVLAVQREWGGNTSTLIQREDGSMNIPIVIFFVGLTIFAVVHFMRKNNKNFDRRYRDIFDSGTYIKLEMLNGDEDVHVFSDLRQVREFIEEAKKHMALWIPKNSRVKRYELIKYSQYIDHKTESEENTDE
jgi:hypothetical protein